MSSILPVPSDSNKSELHTSTTDATEKKQENLTTESGSHKVSKGEIKHKAALPKIVLKGIWSFSKLLNNPFTKDSLVREKLDINDKAIVNTRSLKGNQVTIERFRNYSVFPAFPTEKTPLNEYVLHTYLTSSDSEGNITISTSKLENFLIEKGIDTKNIHIDEDTIKEIIKSSDLKPDIKKQFAGKEGKKVSTYASLSPNAVKLYQALNLAQIKQHMEDINELSKSNANPLNRYGSDFFEFEVSDTLARGLAFIDQDLLNNVELEIPVKIEGSFSLFKYNVSRFNLSDSNIRHHTVDHNKGHPIYFLVPKKNESINSITPPPFLVARGTLLIDTNDQNGAVKSVAADGRNGISLKWIAGNDALKKQLIEHTKEYGRFKVAGHSLGGNIAAVLATQFPGLIEDSTAISGVKISKDIHDVWSKTDPLIRPIMTHYDRDEDLVPGAGPEINGVMIVAVSADKADNPVEAHIRPFTQNGAVFYPGNKVKETGKATRKLNTALVIGAGRVMQENKTQKFIRFFKERLPIFFGKVDMDKLHKSPGLPLRSEAMKNMSSSVEELNNSLEGIENKIDALPVKNNKSFLDTNKKVIINELERAKPLEIRNLLASKDGIHAFISVYTTDENTQKPILKNEKEVIEEEMKASLKKLFENLSPQAAAKIMIAVESREDLKYIPKSYRILFDESLTPDQRNYINLLNRSEDNFPSDAKFSFPSIREKENEAKQANKNP